MTIIKSLTLKDVIETLSIYNIEHCRFPHNYMAKFVDEIPTITGMVLDDRKLIMIDNEQGQEETKETVIHELLHCKHYKLGDLKGYANIERYVEKETSLTYKLLYGHKL